MNDEKELYSDLEEKDLQTHIEMGDNEKYRFTRLGTITFQREHEDPLTLKNVMYVPRLKKNLVSISMLEDRGYDVIFLKGKAFLQHIAMSQVKKIEIRVKNLYKLEKKDQTFTKFCEFKDLVEKESSKKVKALWSDNNGEYVSSEFKNFYTVEGIKRQLMTPHNCQQNGVAKRKNISIIGVVRVMLHDQGLPLHLWVEACNATVYV
eukprot:PITA_28298